MNKILTLSLLLLSASLASLLITSQPSRAATPSNKTLTLDLGDKITLLAVRIPAGRFSMGSPTTEKNRDPNEIPHDVVISKPFYMGQTHVTVEQFAAFVKATDYKTEAEKNGIATGVANDNGKFVFNDSPGVTWRKPGFEQALDHPVVAVSWNDAQAFCAWLSKKSGQSVSLPTEAQWEFACRGGKTTAYPWGDNPDDGKGWANGADLSLKKAQPNAPAFAKFFNWDDNFVYTAPVQHFKPNNYGLHDMIGNTWQWCSDRFADYKKEKTAATDPTGPATGTERVLRGGDWSSFPECCRSAYRSAHPPNFRAVNCGFRITLSAN